MSLSTSLSLLLYLSLVEYAQIDWHDFVICETINFREDEAGYLPPPIQPSQLATRLIQQNKFDKIQVRILIHVHAHLCTILINYARQTQH